MIWAVDIFFTSGTKVVCGKQLYDKCIDCDLLPICIKIGHI